VSRPATTADVVDAVRDASRAGTPLRIRGAGAWLDAGRPAAATDPLDLAALTAIHEYVPGDLTITVGAGITLAALDAATAEHGQWCPLFAWGTDAGTVGATLATATAGPCTAALGAPRDLALGLEVVDGRATVASAGGRVVKNVAGFDLVRLHIGAWGTLGVITAASLRLRARPAVDETWAVTADAGTAATALRDHALALEGLSADAASVVEAGDTACVLVRLGGNTAFVAWARDVVHRLGPAVELPTDVWHRVRTLDAGAPACWREPGETAPDAGVAHVSLARGVRRRAGALPPPPAPHLIVERAPAAAWAARPAATGDVLSRRVQDAFDPDRILNRGVLG
jgi:glycolate oxidase FAD binding subunit